MELDIDDLSDESGDIGDDDLEPLPRSQSLKGGDAKRLIERRFELKRLQRHLADFDESILNLEPLLGDDLSAP